MGLVHGSLIKVVKKCKSKADAVVTSISQIGQKSQCRLQFLSVRNTLLTRFFVSSFINFKESRNNFRKYK